MSGLFGSAASAAASASNTQGDLSKDVEVSQPPEDTVTDLAFSSAADLMAVASWDKKVRIYEINAQGQSQGKHVYEHEAPVFSVDWSKVGRAPEVVLHRQLMLTPALRMANCSFQQARTRRPCSAMCLQASNNKSLPTTSPSSAPASLRLRNPTALWS